MLMQITDVFEHMRNGIFCDRHSYRKIQTTILYLHDILKNFVIARNSIFRNPVQIMGFLIPIKTKTYCKMIFFHKCNELIIHQGTIGSNIILYFPFRIITLDIGCCLVN